MDRSIEIAIQIDHAVYDCIYLALARQNDWQFVTADQRLIRKLKESRDSRLRLHFEIALRTFW